MYIIKDFFNKMYFVTSFKSHVKSDDVMPGAAMQLMLSYANR